MHVQQVTPFSPLSQVMFPGCLFGMYDPSLSSTAELPLPTILNTDDSDFVVFATWKRIFLTCLSPVILASVLSPSF